jgi:hypothetical protein
MKVNPMLWITSSSTSACHQVRKRGLPWSEQNCKYMRESGFLGARSLPHKPLSCSIWWCTSEGAVAIKRISRELLLFQEWPRLRVHCVCSSNINWCFTPLIPGARQTYVSSLMVLDTWTSVCLTRHNLPKWSTILAQDMMVSKGQWSCSALRFMGGSRVVPGFDQPLLHS